MGPLKIQVFKKINSSVEKSYTKCPRCYGPLIDDCESEFEFLFQRCVLCGYRHELKTKNSSMDVSQSLNELGCEF